MRLSSVLPSLARVLLYQALVVLAAVNLKSILTTTNLKEFKKICKTNKNVMVIYSKSDKAAVSTIRWLEGVAKEMKGSGAFVYINCGENKDSKKLCKKEKINPSTIELKHYKDGAFHKNYDRKHTAKSMLNFMQDPSGDAPWEEDSTAKNVVHLHHEQDLNRLRRKEKGPLLIMFYAPWCGYCKKIKPDYSEAANEMKGKAVLAGMDVDKPNAHNVKYQFNITGFPTLIYFEKGEVKMGYGGDWTKEGLIKWLSNPVPRKEEPTEKKEDEWVKEAKEIVHLTDESFGDVTKASDSMLIMFYAPWCGHCKKMKPEFVDAAAEMKEQEIAGSLAAVDCTVHQAACKKFDVSGYPTVEYFSKGVKKFAFRGRKKDEIIDFMKDPSAPPPPPPEDQPWAEVSGPNVLHLHDSDFKESLKKKKHVLVMFYAPWCGHCKSAKPEFEKAGETLADDRKKFLAGVDCTVEKKTCETFGVSGYPTLRYFQYGKNDFDYKGGRKAEDFLGFMDDPKEVAAPPPPPQEPEWSDTPSDVVHLTDANFKEYVKSHPSALVMFYAPWCGHCKNMKPAYMEAATELKTKKPDAVIAAIDCTKHPEIAKKYEVGGYPTVLYFKDGNMYKKYDMQRTKDEFVNFMMGAQNLPPMPITIPWSEETKDVDFPTAAEFDNHMSTLKSALVMFYAPWCGHCKKMKPDYARAGKILNESPTIEGKLVAVDCTKEKEVCTKHEVKGYPTLKHFSNGKFKADFDSERTTSAIVAFMGEQMQDLQDSSTDKQKKIKPLRGDWGGETKAIAFLNKDSFDEYLQDKDVLVMFYAPWCGHCSSLKPTITRAAEKLEAVKSPSKIAAMDCNEKANKPLCAKHQIQGYPTLKYYRMGKLLSEFEEQRTEESIISFMKSQTSADSKRKPTSIDKESFEDLPSNVVHLDESDFRAKLIQMNHTLVMYYAPGCRNFLKIRSEFMRAASRLSGTNLFLVAVNCLKSAAICTAEQIYDTDHRPTMKYYHVGDYVSEYMDSVADAAAIVAFMKKQPRGGASNVLLKQEL